MAMPGYPSIDSLCQDHRTRQAEHPGEWAQQRQEPRQLPSRGRASPNSARRADELHGLLRFPATHAISRQFGLLKGNGRQAPSAIQARDESHLPAAEFAIAVVDQRPLGHNTDARRR